MDTCPQCGGHGQVPTPGFYGNAKITCPRCWGTGYVAPPPTPSLTDADIERIAALVVKKIDEATMQRARGGMR